MAAVRLLIGIDDTDNLESRGTGYRARQLGQRLAGGDSRVRGISRHQLLVDDRIPYTSHNSAACLELETVSARLDSIAELAREFLQRSCSLYHRTPTRNILLKTSPDMRHNTD